MLRARPKASSSASSTAKKLDRAQYRALADFRYALRAFLAFSEAATQQAGVTTRQYQALLAIKASSNEALLIGALAQELLIKHNAAVQLVDRLVLSRLVYRTAAGYDRRAVELRLTRRGETCIRSLAAQHYRELTLRHSDLRDLLRRGKRLR